MDGVVLYGVGSPVVVDVEESIRRMGLRVRCAVHNIDGAAWSSEPSLVVRPSEIPHHCRSLPFAVPLFTPANRQNAAKEAAEQGFLRVRRLSTRRQ